MYRLGIDFGTSHTVAVVQRPDGRVEPLLFDSSPLLVSAVYAEPNGRISVGRDAMHSARIEPGAYEPHPKRRIDDHAVLLGPVEFPVGTLVAAVLGRVEQEATRVISRPADQVVLTCPAGWGPQRRAVLVDAARSAGLGTPHLVPEPLGAACYFSEILGHRVPAGGVLVVYDFGAGTFDAAVVRRGQSGWEVLGVDGLTDVGGLDLDSALVDSFQARTGPEHAQAWERLTNPRSIADRRYRRMLWDDVRAAKEKLSRNSTAGLPVPLLDIDLHVTRESFEELARPLLERTMTTTAGAVARAGVAPHELVGVLLAGGSSRIPLVATLLHQRFGIAPTVTEQPELVVAQGSLLAVATAPAGAGTGVPSTAPTPAPVSASPYPMSAPPYQVSGPPLSIPPIPPAPVSAAPIPGSPVPVSPVPMSPVPAEATLAGTTRSFPAGAQQHWSGGPPDGPHRLSAVPDEARWSGRQPMPPLPPRGRDRDEEFEPAARPAARNPWLFRSLVAGLGVLVLVAVGAGAVLVPKWLGGSSGHERNSAGSRDDGGNPAQIGDPLSGSATPTAGPTASASANGKGPNGNPTGSRGPVPPPPPGPVKETTFLHTASGSNILDNYTSMDNPILNGNPNAVVMVTPNYGPNQVYDNHAIGVFYDGNRWAVFNQDRAALPGGAAFNVHAWSVPSSTVLVHNATAANTKTNRTGVDNPNLAGKTGAFVWETPNWSPPNGAGMVYNDHATGVYYNGTTWAVFNQDRQNIPAGAAFNVVVGGHGAKAAFGWTASAGNSSGDYTDIDNPATNGHPEARLFVTPTWANSVYNNHHFGVWYHDGKWAIFNQDNLSPMPDQASFNVVVF